MKQGDKFETLKFTHHPKKSAEKQAVKIVAFEKYGSQVIRQELDPLRP